MARKLRSEFPGACYHVINRGNYRADVFRWETTKAAFVACLFEACAKSGWVLHAFVVMRNHYHLALETPAGNLVAGMQWLQSTFANRFNRLRGERGHLFQGRYQALLVEEGDPLAQVCHYIHLNPARAGIKSVERVREYAASSYPYHWHPKKRPPFLRLQWTLLAAGNLPDNAKGWKSYAHYLSWQNEAGPAGKSKAYVKLSRGWALGGAEFKAALLRDHAVARDTRAWEAHGVREVREAIWRVALEQALKAVGKDADEVRIAAKSASWKLAIASWVKSRTQAPNRWLSEHLNLGAPASCSSNLARFRNREQATDKTWLRLSELSQHDPFFTQCADERSTDARDHDD